jgi:hypothetical protein
MSNSWGIFFLLAEILDGTPAPPIDKRPEQISCGYYMIKDEEYETAIAREDR